MSPEMKEQCSERSKDGNAGLATKMCGEGGDKQAGVVVWYESGMADSVKKAEFCFST